MDYRLEEVCNLLTISETNQCILLHHARLMYAQSGTGKTYLLNAGLIPLLRADEFELLLPALRARLGSRIDNSLIVWDIQTGEIVQQLKGHTDAVTSVAFTPGGQYIVSASKDKTLLLWATLPRLK